MKWHFDMPPVDGTPILAKIRTHYYDEVESPPFFYVVYAKTCKTIDGREKLVFIEHSGHRTACWQPDEIVAWTSLDELEFGYEKAREANIMMNVSF